MRFLLFEQAEFQIQAPDQGGSCKDDHQPLRNSRQKVWPENQVCQKNGATENRNGRPVASFHAPSPLQAVIATRTT